MRILVTGGAGFLGSHLIDRLMQAGHEVICLDNFYTGSKRNILQWLDNPKFEVIRHDVTEPIRLEVDQIYHLACPASPVHYQYNPVKTIKTNVIGTLNMLGLAKRVKARFFLASTSEVYGDPEVHPQSEDYRGNVNPIGIRACYDPDTEILTENGWVRFPELKKGDRVATLNANNQVEYHIPDEYIVQSYVGNLLRFANVKFDLCVTPNHQMYVRSKTGKLKFLRADEERHWHSWKVLTGAEFLGEEREWYDLGQAPRNAKIHYDRVRMDDWLEFLGYYISEGCTHVRKRVRVVNGRDYDVADYNILIAQQDPEGRTKIAACLSRTGFKFYDSDDHQFRICSKQLADILLPLGKSGDKYIPREFLNLSQRQSRILFDALILGDGSRRGDCYTYYSKSKQLADDVQELALRCGYAASVVSHAVGRDLYRVNIRVAKDAHLVPPETIRYAGNVYCVNVKNHVILVRRNGKTAFCGNCYDEGKRVAETLAYDYHRQNGLDVRVVRIFNTFGPRMLPNDGRVVSNFIVQALQGKSLTVYGDGSQTRSFCYVSDLIEGFIRLMNSDRTEPVNIGNPGEYTILELAQTIQNMVNPDAKLSFKPLPQDDPKQRQPDITRAKEWLGWGPSVPLEEGLKLTINYFRDRLAEEGKISQK